jgi:HEAT repeat protein
MPRAAAIGALAKIRTEPAMAAVAAHLGDKNYNVRVRAINALAEMGEPAVPALAAALRQSDPRARVAAATALGGMCQRPERRNAAAVSTLAAALNDDSADVRRVAIEYLDRAFRHDGSRLAGAEGKVAFSPSLVAAARNHEPATRASALRLLGHTRDRRAFNLLVAALGDPEVVVRTGAATGLATLGDKRAVGPMIAMLGDRHPWARSSAASLLPRFGDARTVAPLVGALGDRDSGVRASAAQSLMRLKDPRGKAFLLSGLKDPDPKTRKEMVATVAQFVERAWFESDQKSRHRAGPPPRLPEYAWAVEPLIALLGDPDAGVRQEGAGALGMIGDRRAVRPLIRLLRDDSLAVRPIAAGALGKLQDEAAVGPLITLLKTLEVTGRGGPPPFFSSGRGRDPAEYIGLMAVSALSDITGEHLGYDAAAWETWWQQRQASTASSGWKNPRYLALFGALLALIVGLGLFVIIRRRRAGQPAPAAK